MRRGLALGGPPRLLQPLPQGPRGLRRLRQGLQRPGKRGFGPTNAPLCRVLWLWPHLTCSCASLRRMTTRPTNQPKRLPLPQPPQTQNTKHKHTRCSSSAAAATRCGMCPAAGRTRRACCWTRTSRMISHSTTTSSTTVRLRGCLVGAGWWKWARAAAVGGRRRRLSPGIQQDPEPRSYAPLS